MSGAGQLTRRAFLGATALPLAACAPDRQITGAFNGPTPERGHLLRDRPASKLPPVARRCDVLIVGGGIAGLSAARALRRGEVDDFALLELEDEAGGNSRGGKVGGLPCPLGAHYLPVPGDDAPEVREFVEEQGLARRVGGRWVPDERNLCHSPQERLFFNGRWQEGLLPVQGVGARTLEQYRLFAQRVTQAQKLARFVLPLRGSVPASHRALDALTFAAWLDRERLVDDHLRWYLDYCCRDDYGAGLASVSAWAGLHYFASRHGFQAPGEAGERDLLFTWPEGNGWLATRLAQPLGERLQRGRVVLRIAPGKHGVEVDAWDVAAQRMERWQAGHCIVALPLFVAERVMTAPPRALSEAALRMRYAPWVVANVHIERPLRDHGEAPPAWDNVLYGTRSLGYVDAGHQKLDQFPGPTVLTWYRALGDEPECARAVARAALDRMARRGAGRTVGAASRPARQDPAGRGGPLRPRNGDPRAGDAGQRGAGCVAPAPAGPVAASAFRARGPVGLFDLRGSVHARPAGGRGGGRRAGPDRPAAQLKPARRAGLAFTRASALRSRRACTGTPRVISSQPWSVTIASSSMRMPMLWNCSGTPSAGRT